MEPPTYILYMVQDFAITSKKTLLRDTFYIKKLEKSCDELTIHVGYTIFTLYLMKVFISEIRGKGMMTYYTFKLECAGTLYFPCGEYF